MNEHLKSDVTTTLRSAKLEIEFLSGLVTQYAEIHPLSTVPVLSRIEKVIKKVGEAKS